MAGEQISLFTTEDTEISFFLRVLYALWCALLNSLDKSFCNVFNFHSCTKPIRLPGATVARASHSLGWFPEL